jgi:hypothetical protein
MKKLLILLTGFLFATITLQAQQKHSKFFAELSGGASFALGKFGNKAYNGFNDADPSGSAKTGLAGQLSLGYYINESVGVLLLPGYSVHKTDHSRFEESIKANNANDPSYQLSMQTDKWKLIKLMAGGFFVTPLTGSSQLALVTKLTAGVCKTDFPGYSYSDIGMNGMYRSWTSQKSIALPWTFCYQVSVGLKYKLKDHLHLLFDINSFNSTPSKERTFFSQPTSTIGGPPTTVQKNVKYKLAELNTLVGIGFDF